MKDEDCNTIFFHSLVKERPLINRIASINNEFDQQVVESDAINKEVVDFYSSLWSPQDGVIVESDIGMVDSVP